MAPCSCRGRRRRAALDQARGPPHCSRITAASTHRFAVAGAVCERRASNMPSVAQLWLLGSGCGALPHLLPALLCSPMPGPGSLAKAAMTAAMLG